METPFVDIHTHHITNIHDATAIVNYDMLNGSPSDDDHDGMFSYGLHPWWFDEHTEPEFLERQLILLEQLLSEGRLAAIGETGIDKMHKQSLLLQKESFEQHILLSERYHKPLIIHDVKGNMEILELYQKYQPKQAWIIHGFNGGSEEVKQLTDKGLYLSVGENILDENRKIARSITSIPLDYLFLETDTGSIGIEQIYMEVAKKIEVPVSTLRERVFQNFDRVMAKNSTEA